MFVTLTSKSYREYWMGLAMILVILHHLCIWHSQDFLFFPINSSFVNGEIGVNIFLLFSAFGLCFSFQTNSLKKFYYKRAIRILPLYLFFCLVGYFTVFQFEESLFSLLFRQVSGLALITYGIEWYIPALLLIYVSFPVLYKLSSYIYIYKPLLYIVAYILVFLEVAFEAKFGFDLYLINLLCRFLTIFCGIIMYKCVEEKNSKTLISFLAFCAFLSIINFKHSVYPYLPLIITTISLIKIELPFQRILQFIGKYTLEIYLAQVIAIHYIYRSLNNSIWTDMVICLFLTVAIAFLFSLVNNVFKRLL